MLQVKIQEQMKKIESLQPNTASVVTPAQSAPKNQPISPIQKNTTSQTTSYVTTKMKGKKTC